MNKRRRINNVSDEEVRNCIHTYFKRKYPIDEDVQPNFWEAVVKLCCSPNADVSEYLINDNYCIEAKLGNIKGFMHVSSINEDASNVVELATLISEEVCAMCTC